MTTTGKIVTFYSFKGGVGRSMALANIAWILASNGKRVLVVDWDLESPGLHRYFAPFIPPRRLEEADGVVDMVGEYAIAAQELTEQAYLARRDVDPNELASLRKEFADVRQREFRLDWSEPGWGELFFLSAGRQDTGYPDRAASIRWAEIIRGVDGELFFAELRASMLAGGYEYVLIDSRTGWSDNASICLRLLPDILVVAFTTNTQSIEGGAGAAVDAVTDATRPQPVRVLPVATRVDSGELERQQRRLDFAALKFDTVLAHLDPAARKAYWGRMQIPYVPFFSYEETLAGIAVPPGNPTSLLGAYERLVAEITEGAITQYQDLPERRKAAVQDSFEQTPQRPAVGAALVVTTPRGRPWADWIRTDLTRAGVRVSSAGGANPVSVDFEDTVVVVLGRDLLLDPGVDRLRRLLAKRYESRTRHMVGVVGVLIDDGLDSSLEPFSLIDRILDFRVLSEQDGRGRLLAEFGQSLGVTDDGVEEPVAGTRFPHSRPRVSNAPPENPRFVRRRVDYLERIRDHFRWGPAAVPALVLTGPPGFGKSEIAREYVVRYGFDYDVVWWIRGTDPGDARNDIRRLGQQAMRVMPELSESVGTGVSGHRDADWELACLDDLREGRFGARWLLVYDDVTDPDLLDRLFVAPAASGHVLVTVDSAMMDWPHPVSVVPVLPFTLGESQALIQSGAVSVDAATARLIAETFDNVPALIDQAMRYIESASLPAAEAAQEYIAQHEAVVRQLASSGSPFTDVASRKAVASCVVGVNELGHRSPASLRLVELLSLMAPGGVPTALLGSTAVVDLLGRLDRVLEQTRTVRRLWLDIVHAQLGFLHRERGLIRLNRIVRDVVRARLRQSGELGARRAEVVRILAGYAPPVAEAGSDEGRARLAELARHLTGSGIEEELDAATSQDADVRRWLVIQTWYLGSVHRYERALRLGRLLMDRWAAESPDGADDYYRLWLGRHVATALRELGKIDDAIALRSELYDRQLATLGPDHPHTLQTARSRASDLRAQGRFSDAVEVDQKTFDDATQFLLPDHPETLAIGHNLAYSLFLHGSIRQAVDQADRTVGAYQRLFGARSAEVWTSAVMLGEFRAQLGHHELAGDVFREALRYYEQHSDSANAAVAESLLATAVRIGGGPNAVVFARNYHRKALAVLRAAPGYGEDDIRTMACAMRYATDLSLTGSHQEAVDLGREQLARYRRRLPTLGTREHPFVYWCMADLSVYLSVAGQAEEAVDLSREALSSLRFDDQISMEHFLTYAVAIDHANNLVAVGEVDEALRLDQETHADLVRFYGANYPDVAAAHDNLLDTRRRVEASGSDRTAGYLNRRAVPIEIPVL